jgi:hypothetical protein
MLVESKAAEVDLKAFEKTFRVFLLALFCFVVEARYEVPFVAREECGKKMYVCG